MITSARRLLFFLTLSFGIVAGPGPFAIALAQAAAGAPSGTLEQIIPGYYVYLSDPRISGVIATGEGVVVIDALSNEAMAMHERQLISEAIGEPVRYLISSSHHGNYSRGNSAYQDAIRIGHEDYRADLLDEGSDPPSAEEAARLPHLTYAERMSIYLGGKEIQIIHVGPAHTRGDSIVYVPEDRIVFTSEVFFYDRFPFMDSGGLNWIDAIDFILGLDADYIVPGNGAWRVEGPDETREALHLSRQILIEARDAVEAEIAQGATEDEVAARVLLQDYEDMIGYDLTGGGTTPQREVMVRRMYQELTGALP